MGGQRGQEPDPAQQYLVDLPDLRGQVALVTGGGRGFGRGIARALAAAGAAVAVVSRTEEQLAETVALLEREGAAGRALGLPADVTDRGAVARVVGEAEARLGPLDLLVNNAAIISIAPVWGADPDEWWRVVEVNLRGPFLCAQAVLLGMMARGRGRIVNVTSGTAWTDIPYGSAYVASKAGLHRLTSSLAAEAREHGIAAFTLNPGGADTAMQEYLRTVRVPEWRRYVDARLPSWGQSWAPPERTGRLVARLASGMADALTGRVFSSTDDLDDMVRRADEIVRDDFYTARVRK